tara:strand:- start:376 stop:1203 length:828 start_codon:yes stop_codon:yes gene_type:complete
MANGRNRSRVNQTFIPQYTYTGVGRNRRAVPMNAAAISEIVANNPETNPGLLETNKTNSGGGIIGNANANSNIPIVNNLETNNNQNAQENIFGERLAQALFPGIGQNNKGLIDAAILRGSLELLKPRQAGENLASQLGRGLEAGVKVGEDVQKRRLEALTTQAALLKAQQGGKTQTTITKEKRDAFKNIIDPLYKSDISFRNDLELLKTQSGDIMGLNNDTRSLLELEAMTIEANSTLSSSDSMKQAVKNLLSGNLSSSQTETGTTGDKFAGAGR